MESPKISWYLYENLSYHNGSRNGTKLSWIYISQYTVGITANDIIIRVLETSENSFITL